MGDGLKVVHDSKVGNEVEALRQVRGGFCDNGLRIGEKEMGHDTAKRGSLELAGRKYRHPP